MKDLRGFITLTEGERLTGYTAETLRRWADIGKIRAIRDPAGRRLLLREDVQKIAEERQRTAERRRGAAR